MAEVPEDEIKVDITLGHVGRHFILHALTVIEAAISQVCLSICDSVSVSLHCICVHSGGYVCMSLLRACMHMCVYACVQYYCEFRVKNTSWLFSIFQTNLRTYKHNQLSLYLILHINMK